MTIYMINQQELLDDILQEVAWWDMRVEEEMAEEPRLSQNPLLRNAKDTRRHWTAFWHKVNNYV